MKKELLLGSAMLMVFGMVELASASPVYFDLAGASTGSSVAVFESVPTATLTGNLAGNLDSQTFTLNDGATQTVDFFTLTASGFGGGNYQVQATLAFDLPNPMNPATGSGKGKFGSLFGYVSAGSLTWISQPADYLLADGNTISVSFENGCKIGVGNTAMVHAYITNRGGNSTPTNSPVPEPATMFLFGTGLVGFAGFGLKRRKA